MLHIVLAILKWIGIILLAILGLVLLIVLAVLFVPVRYRINGDYEEKPDASATVSWLFHLLHIKVRFRDSLFWQVRILGIPFLDSRRPPKRRVEKSKKNDAEDDSGTTHTDSKETAVKNQSVTVVNADKKTEEKSEKAAEKKLLSNEAKITDDEQDTEPEKTGILGKIKGFIIKVKAFFHALIDRIRNIRYTIERFCDKINDVRGQIDYYHGVLTGEEGMEAVGLLKTQLGRLLLHIAPRKFLLDAEFGFDDPATTGQVMAIAGMLYPLYQYDIRLRPDFDAQNTWFRLKLRIRGRIRAFTLIRIAWKVYFDKNLKRVLAMLKKED